MNNKCCQYSFYIPANDQPLCDFLEAQSNLSMSIRLLIKAFLANYSDTMPDVTIVDLKELLNNMQFKEGIVDNIIDYKDGKSKKSVENSNIKQSDASENGVFGDTSDEEIIVDTFDDTDEIGDTNDISMFDDEFKDNASNSDNSGEEESDNVISDTEDSDINNSNIENFDTENSDIKDSEIEDDIPVVEVEPESPKKIINSSRDSYNSRQNAQSAASMDDIMSMLGGE
jgi:hypothetical protein